jgi:hypothetical protein
MNLVGLEFDHPAFPSRLRLTLETWLSFAAAGAGYGVFSVACAGFITNENLNGHTSRNVIVIIDVILNVMGALYSFSSRVYRDYRLLYGHEPSVSQLFLLELLRLGGFFFSKVFLLQHAAIVSKPLHFLAPEPSALLSSLYTFLVLWGVSRKLPVVTVISSHPFTIPKFVAHMTGIIFQVWIERHKEMMAAALLKPLSLDNPDARTLYRYTQILTPQTIRLLRIDSRQKPASCILKTVKLDDAPPYWAVSYLWGSEEKPQSLKITSYSSPDAGYIPITSNCAAAIQTLIPMGVRYLWIDAVCIDQSNTREKELQVPLMGQIYSQASLVIGHLYTDNIMSVTLLLHRMVQSLANGNKFTTDSGGTFLIYRTLSEIFSHQYFQRAWIVQEMVLAKSLLLIHGKDCISLDHLITISNASKYRILPDGSHGESLRECFTEMPQGENAWKLQVWLQFHMSLTEFKERARVIEKLRLSIGGKDVSQRLTVAQIVDDNLLLQAKNPRDQVYALLGLAFDSTVPELQPNYSLAVSDKEVFTRISWHYLRDGSHLNLFLSAGLASKMFEPERSRTPGLPSWVYDFASGPTHEPRLGNWAANIERNRAVRLTCCLSPEYLSVRGTIIDKVAFVASQAHQPTDHSEKLGMGDVATISRDFVKVILSLGDETQGMAQNYVPDPYPGEVKRQEAYWRTMIMDRFCNQTPAPSEAEEFFVMIHDASRPLCTNPPSQSSEHKAHLILSALNQGRTEELVKVGINSIMERIRGIWMPYTFVVLDSGYMGWSPHGVQAGDVFCLFDGCIVPFVLRPTAAADTFSLWGDGYVHGFMPGQQPGVEGRPKEWLKLV